MRVGRDEQPTSQILQLRMRRDGAYQALTDAPAAAFRSNEHIGDVGKGRPIGDHAAEPDRGTALQSRKAKRAADGTVKHAARHLTGPIALARDPIVYAVKVDTA